MHHLVRLLAAAALLTAAGGAARSECGKGPLLRLAVATPDEAGGLYRVASLTDDRAPDTGLITFADAKSIALSLELNGQSADLGKGARLDQIQRLARSDGLVVMDGKGGASLVLGRVKDAEGGTALGKAPRSLAEAERLVLRALGYSGYVVGADDGELVVAAAPALLTAGAQAIVVQDSVSRLKLGEGRKGAAWLALRNAKGNRGRFEVLLGGTAACGAKVVFAPH